MHAPEFSIFSNIYWVQTIYWIWSSTIPSRTRYWRAMEYFAALIVAAWPLGELFLSFRINDPDTSPSARPDTWTVNKYHSSFKVIYVYVRICVRACDKKEHTTAFWYGRLATFNCKSCLNPFLIYEVKPWGVSMVSMSIWQEKLATPFLTATQFRKRNLWLCDVQVKQLNSNGYSLCKSNCIVA